MRTALLLLTVVTACTGSIAGSSEDAPPLARPEAPPARPQAPSTSAAEPPSTCSSTTALGTPARLRRLSGEQYRRTVATLFAGRSRNANRDLTLRAEVRAPFTFENKASRFSTLAVGQTLAADTFLNVMVSAQDVARVFVATPQAAACAGQAQDFGTCARTLVTEKGALLFRRPLTDAEVAKYTGLITSARGAVDGATALAHGFRALLVAPQFLFRTETGGGKRRLTAYELASALAYDLTDGPPDEPLWDDAQSGALSDPAAIARHVARLLGPLEQAAPLRRFVRETFGYERVLDVAKDQKFHDAAGLLRDTDLFVAEVLKSNGRKHLLGALLTSNVGFVDKTTAPNYGLTSSTAAPQRVTFDGDRVGLLGQPAWLAGYAQPERTDPIQRGRFVRESLLCGDIPMLTIEDIPHLSDDPARTLREKLALHTENPSCRGCHELMDPLGLGLESFDHVGRARTTEAGRPIVTDGRLVGAGDQDGAFKGLKELATKLASSPATTTCFARLSFEYWLGRAPAPQEACVVGTVRNAFVQSGGDYLALLATLYISDALNTKN